MSRILEAANGTLIDIVADDSMEHARAGAAGIASKAKMADAAAAPIAAQSGSASSPS